MAANVAAYRVPARAIRVGIEVLRSRFIASVMRADSVTAARSQLDRIRDEMADASHHAYAFRVGYGASITEGKSDDGEPRGTAGAPILAILRGSDLGDILIVVTRYFGGRKLGTGGLVRAYGDAARTALAELPVEERIEQLTFTLEVAYPFLERLRRQMTNFGAEEITCEYGVTVLLRVTLAKSTALAFRDAVMEMSAGRIRFHPGCDCEVPGAT